MKIRSLLYRTARLLGDGQALASGSPRKMAKRYARKLTGRKTMGWLRRLTG